MAAALEEVAADAPVGDSPVLAEFLAVPQHGNALGRIEGDDERLHFVKLPAVTVELPEQIPEAQLSELVDEPRMVVRFEVLERSDRE